MVVNYLVSVENLKKKGLIHRDADTKILSIAIKRVQDMVIQEAVGSPLYRALLTRTENKTWDADYRELMDDYVVPCLVAHVDFKVALIGTKKITNKGAVRVDDENSTTLTDQELNPFQRELLEDAGFYRERLIGALKDDCGTKWTEYDDTDSDRSNHDLKKAKKGYQSQWWT